jgi:hypothetical protein
MEPPWFLYRKEVARQVNIIFMSSCYRLMCICHMCAFMHANVFCNCFCGAPLVCTFVNVSELTTVNLLIGHIISIYYFTYFFYCCLHLYQQQMVNSILLQQLDFLVLLLMVWIADIYCISLNVGVRLLYFFHILLYYHLFAMTMWSDAVLCL